MPILQTIWAKLLGVAAAGGIAVAGLAAAGALPGTGAGNPAAPANDATANVTPAELPEPAEQGQTFAVAIQAWATCVAQAAPAHDPAEGEFDPVAACDATPHPSAFDEVGEPEENGTLPEPAQQGQAFAAAMRDWAKCVGETAAAREDSDEDAGRFDPFEACGDLPHPSVFGIGGGPPEGIPSGPPEGIPSGPPEGIPSGPPEGIPSGPPAGIPSGPPAGIPSGPPAGIPSGPPAGIPSGPPAGTPSGPPAGTPSGPPAGTPSGPPAGVPAGGP